MLDYLLKENAHVERALREELGLDDRDFLFIKECIFGPLGVDDDGNKVSRALPSLLFRSVGVRRLLLEVYVGRGVEKWFLYDVVSNKHDGMDVDRFDYLLRDQKATGVQCDFSSDTLERLLRNVRVRRLAHSQELRICFAEKAASCSSIDLLLCVSSPVFLIMRHALIR